MYQGDGFFNSIPCCHRSQAAAENMKGHPVKKHRHPVIFSGRGIPLLALAIIMLVFSTCSIPLFHDHSRRFVFQKSTAGLTDQLFLSREGNPVEFQLTNEAGYECTAPAWSPDGSRIAFVMSDVPAYTTKEVYVINGNGSGRVHVSVNPGLRDNSPSWSPDGSKLSWLTIVSGGDTHLIVAQADGSNPRDLTMSPSLNVQNPGAPQWSPDSRMIIISADIPAIPPDPASDGEIVVVDVNAGMWRRLTANGLTEYSPVWSPDGRRIAYIRDAGARQLVTCHPDGSAEIVLTSTSGAMGNPAWSPDGRTILFYSDDGHSSTYTLRIIPRNGIGEDIEICDRSLVVDEIPISFSPDGKSILCIDSSLPHHILKVRTDGSGCDVLPTTGDSLANPAWAPR